MSEIILAIEEVHDIPHMVKGEGERDHGGYEITTTLQTIRVLIDEEHQCCERTGYLATFDKPEDYIGARLVSIERMGGDGAVQRVQAEEDRIEYSIFITFVTDRGAFQIAAYNEHNGYYGHSVRVESRQLAVTTRI